MKRIWIVWAPFWWACGTAVSTDHDHEHDHAHDHTALYTATVYSDNLEVMVKSESFKAGHPAAISVYITSLGDTFRPVGNAQVSVSLVVDGKGVRNTAAADETAGLYRTALRPSVSGAGTLQVDVEAGALREKLSFYNMQVKEPAAEAEGSRPPPESGLHISYAKEKIWSTVFASEPARSQSMQEGVRTSGQLVTPPEDEVAVIASASGILRFMLPNNSPGMQVRAGQLLFAVTGGGVAAGNNLDVAIENARLEMELAKAEYRRLNELIEDKLVTREEFQQAKLRYQTSEVNLSNLTKNYSNSGKRLYAPVNGFLRNILVTEGQYVEAGQLLANVQRTQRILLRADVPVKDIGKIDRFREASFILQQQGPVYHTSTLKGKLLSYSRTATDNSPVVPVFFEMNTLPEFLPGAYAEVYLKTEARRNVLSVPSGALLEEQGAYYVFIQTGGESFVKREVKPGARDGERVEIISGITENERVVTKGAYKVKLASVSNALPVHDHAH